MLSPFSSFFRESFWGGMPVSLWAFAVFAFLAYRAIHLLWRGQVDQDEARFLVATTALPCAMSLGYGYLAIAEVHATCKVCVGIYVSSFAALVSAVFLLQRATRSHGASGREFGLWFLEGVGFVTALSLLYVVFAPPADTVRSARGCGSLVQREDPSNVMIALAPNAGAASAIELLDPLCPACRAFEHRLDSSSLKATLDLKAVLFPLDRGCNWMVPETLHPGACAVSEAVLCAGNGSGGAEKARQLLSYAFEHQEELREQAGQDDRELRKRLEREFPELRGCLGTPLVKNRLTKSLRWAVANALPVLTPQLFVEGTRLCDEDTDLGLEFTLHNLLEHRGSGERSPSGSKKP